MMLKNIVILIVIIIIFSCSVQKKTPISRDIEPIEVNNDTIKIVNEELEYEIIIYELGFDSWLVTQQPIWYYTNENLSAKNYRLVVEWNQRVLQPFKYNPSLYEQSINYEPTVDYGIEVNYLLYMYFQYFQQKYNQKLRYY